VVGGRVWWCEWWCGQSFNVLQPFSTSFSGHLLLVIRYPFLIKIIRTYNVSFLQNCSAEKIS
jgi:hypothetical protein